MTYYKKHLSEPWFSLVNLELKNCEGRLNKGDFSNMKKGDYITFENNDFDFTRKCVVKITSIHHYNTFQEYLISEKLNKCLPGITNIEDGKKIYYKYFTQNDENLYKIIAIRIKKIKSNQN